MFKYILAVTAFLIFTTPTHQVYAQNDELFSGMELFELLGYEKLLDPTDEFGDFVELPIEEIEPDGIGYRFYVAQENEPDVLYQDVCPTGYEATWYTFDAEDDIPISIGFSAEIEPASGDKAAWFSPIYMDNYRSRVGNPTFTPPVYVAFCGYSDTRGDYRRSHSIFVENESNDLTVEVGCQILVNNSGSREVLASEKGQATTYCFGEK